MLYSEEHNDAMRNTLEGVRMPQPSIVMVGSDAHGASRCIWEPVPPPPSDQGTKEQINEILLENTGRVCVLMVEQKKDKKREKKKTMRYDRPTQRISHASRGVGGR